MANVTESLNENSLTIDEMNSLEIVTLMHKEDGVINEAVQKALPDVAKAIDLVVEKWRGVGRVFVVGAGTSGRLGVLDAAELGPTFSVEDGRWVGFVAGGKDAMWSPLEQHEDDEKVILTELKGYDFGANDVVIAVSASGSTPYSVAALSYANEIGASTISISCNHATISTSMSDCGIEVVVGPEVIRGSTRLKAGTAQKIVLNMISTGTMIRLGKVYGNEMVDVQLINKKLAWRAEQTLIDVTGIAEVEAKELMERTNNNLKVAIFIALTGADMTQAEAFLLEKEGHLKAAIKAYQGR
ncbi:N-acetylmuramic acid 6-phosphate etherase [Aquibacillus salsiterrae]|uniref:N-acetylmuramic acid 6-phosphate etherase n=1 Tax=Aquibacillus salsiterrae TaxID=2950439 RepID=A0A9X4AHQ2_9BACI|nr:N-acetylmuramic acid 6-phosphate etherase [Aquibacillus salsiterrae]MDC3418570.1 N-acetylmuramic acid 6-phosphate etherase [Aquibacillus salsiterrae]